jgi:3-oxoadipate enol-lactonase
VDVSRLHFRFDGPESAPVVVFANSIGTTLELWDAQVLAFAGPFRMLRYDQLGHGRSEVPPGPYTVELLGRELLGLCDELGVGRFSFCGLSLGGAVGMWLGANAPDRLDSLVLAATSAYFGPPERWLERAEAVRSSGMTPLADATMGRWFTPTFPWTPLFRQTFVAVPAEGYAGCCEALGAWDFRAELGSVSAPTLVLVGSEDPATPPDQARLIADGIPGAALEVVPDAAHLVNVEQADRFNRTARNFLAGVELAV